MPEHRDGTPAEYVLLESFLWRDFDTPAAWSAWVRARGLTSGLTTSPDVAEAPDAYAAAMRLRGALRALAAANTGYRVERGGARTDAEAAAATVAAGTNAEVAAATATLNALIAECDVRPAVGGHGRVALRAEAPAAGPVAVVLGLALQAMWAGVWRRFKLCPEPSCRASFYDASKNAAKTWCAMATCGSRTKMRRLRARRRA